MGRLVISTPQGPLRRIHRSSFPPCRKRPPPELHPVLVFRPLQVLSLRIAKNGPIAPSRGISRTKGLRRSCVRRIFLHPSHISRAMDRRRATCPVPPIGRSAGSATSKIPTALPQNPCSPTSQLNQTIKCLLIQTNPSSCSRSTTTRSRRMDRSHSFALRPMTCRLARNLRCRRAHPSKDQSWDCRRPLRDFERIILAHGEWIL